MKYSKLGKSDLLVSEIGIGCMSLTGGDLEKNRYVVQQAYDAGINYFDTADMYEKGQNETMLGDAVKSFRDKVVLATKVGNSWKADGSGWEWKPSKEYILREVDSSLSRLKTDYIDLYQLHGGTKEDPMDEIVEAFERLVQSGKIRYYGISSIRPNVFLEYAQKSAIVSNMMQYSLLDRRPEPYFAELSSAGVGVVARGSLAQGLLVDKPAKPYLEGAIEDVVVTQNNVAQMAKSKHISSQAVALSYVLSQAAVTSAIVGVRTTQQLEDLLVAKNELARFSPQELSQLREGIGEVAYREHL